MFRVSRIRLAAPVVLADVLCAGPATAGASSAVRDAQRSAEERRRNGAIFTAMRRRSARPALRNYADEASRATC